MSAVRAAAALPRESDEPVLQFAFAKRMLYRTRMTWVAALVACGLIAQVAFLNVLPGVPFARVQSIVRLDRDMQRWDESAVDVSSPAGCALFVLAAAAVAGLTMASAVAFGVAVAAIVAVDGAVLVALQWFSGMRTISRKPDLVLKVKHLTDVVGAEQETIDAAGTLHGQLLLTEHDAGAAPEDARILIDVNDPPGKMLAVQGQVVLNRVQGKPYPYFYCVALAERGSGLATFAERLAPGGDGTTIEVKPADDVDVVVVRQTTSKTSGYHTKPDVSRRLLLTALDIATGFRDGRR